MRISDWSSDVCSSDLQSILSQTLKSVTVEEAYPGYPAYDAGIRVGDIVIEANDMRIEGGNASDFRKLLHGPVGNVVKLKVLHQSGDIETILVKAGPRPEKVPD